MKASDFAFIEPHERFERGWNRLQQGIEIGVAVVVCAGLAGLFGSGPVSSYSGRFQSIPVRLTYERLLRRTVQSEVVLNIDGPIGKPTLGGSVVEVTLPTVFTHHFDVVSTSPRSLTMRADAEGVTYTFELGPAHKGEIIFTAKPRSPGLVDASIIVDGARQPLRQFVYP